MNKNFVDNIAGDEWRPGSMSEEIALDYNLVSWSFDRPKLLGFMLRLLFSSFGLVAYVAINVAFLPWWGWIALLPLLPLASNRLEPMPAGGKSDLWKDKNKWVRWYLWHVRNPFEDLKKYYLGYGYAEECVEQRLTENLKITWADFGKVKIPFPYYRNDNVFGKLQVMIGWKARGIVSFTVRNNN